MSGIVPVKYIEDGDGVIHPIQATSYTNPYIELQKYLYVTTINSVKIRTKQLRAHIYNKPNEACYLALEQLVGRNSNSQRWVTLPYEPQEDTDLSEEDNKLLLSYQYKIYLPLINGRSVQRFQNWKNLPYPSGLISTPAYAQTSWDISNSDNIQIDIVNWARPMIKPMAEVFTTWEDFRSRLRQLISSGSLRPSEVEPSSWYDLNQTAINEFLNQHYYFTEKFQSNNEEAFYYAIWNWDTPMPLFAGGHSKIIKEYDGQLLSNYKIASKNLTFRFQLQDSNHENLGIISNSFILQGNCVRSSREMYHTSDAPSKHLWIPSETSLKLNPNAISIKL